MPPKTMHLTLDGGMDQATYARHVDPQTATLDGVNVRHHRNGGVEKRPGCALYAAAPTAGTGKLFTHRDELLLSDGHSMCSATATSGSTAFLAKDKYPEAMPSLTPIAGANILTEYIDIGYSTANGGIYCYAWTDGASEGVQGTPYVTIQDATTGAEILSTYPLYPVAAWAASRVVVVGTTIIILNIDNSGHINRRIFNPATGAFTDAGADILTDGVAGEPYAVAATATRFYIAYRNNVGALILKSFDNTATLVATKTSTEASTSASGFGLSATAGESVVLTYVIPSGGNTLVRMAAYDDTLTTETTAPVTLLTTVTATYQPLRTSSCRVSSTQSAVLCDGLTTNAFGMRAGLYTVSSGAAVGNASLANRATFWATPGSQPFVASTSPLRVCAWIHTGRATYQGASYLIGSNGAQPAQFSLVLADLLLDDTTTSATPVRPLCWDATRYSLVDLFPTAQAPHAVNVGTKWHTITRTLASGLRSTQSRATADFASSAMFASAELAGTLFVAPGWVWDGGRLFEQGYCYWPQGISNPTFSAASGHLTATGKYRRRITYEWIDNRGNRHQSQPSDYVEFTVSGGNDTATYQAPCLCVTARCDAASGFAPAVNVAVWGTGDINAGDDPNTYYRVFDIQSTPLNDPTVESITIVDKGRVTLTQQPTLYTGGGALPNVQPRGFTALSAYRNRLWIAYGSTVAYSKAYVEGDAVSFTDAFTLPLEQADSVTALWVMDDTLYIATTSRIYFLQADGPADNGTQNDIATPSRVATDQGCVDPRSVVVTPVGTIYQSRRGLELLDRARQVLPTPLSVRVQSEIDAFPTITSGTVHPDSSGGWVTFTMVGASSGERLAFDYSAQKWARDEVLGSGASSKKILSAVVSNGTLYFLTSDGNVYVELPSTDAGAYLDAGAMTPMKVRTAWIHQSGLQGYQFVRKAMWMGDTLSPHDLTIKVFYDYATTPAATWTWTAAELAAMPIPQVSIDPAPQRCQAVSFEISDSAPSGGPSVGNGRGSLFAGLAVAIETEGEMWKLPAAQKG